LVATKRSGQVIPSKLRPSAFLTALPAPSAPTTQRARMSTSPARIVTPPASSTRPVKGVRHRTSAFGMASSRRWQISASRSCPSWML
jgi:hypothetical protein